jgi:ELWxxDGT repeat protein
MKHTLLSMSLLAISVTSSFAQLSPAMDIFPGTAGSQPNRLTVFGKHLVFFASDGNAAPASGMELWTLDSNGSPMLAYNINPGVNGSTNVNNYLTMATVGGKLYFAANNGTVSRLHSWDAKNGAAQVKELTTITSPSLSEIVAYKNKVYFANSDAATGIELWEYDPAQTKSRLVKDIVVGPSASSPSNFTVYNNKLYFTATETSSGNELYVFDGDSARRVADINPGANSSSPLSLTVIAGRMYFSATEPTYGRELYSLTDTVITRHTDIWVNTSSSMPVSATGQKIIGTINNMVYFSATDATTGYQLYKFDPKANTTTLAYNLNPTGNGNPHSFTMFNKKLYFSATDPTKGTELWAFDGVSAPYVAANIDTTTNLSGNPLNLTVFNDALYFTATEFSTTGTELYMFKDSALSVQNVRFTADVKVYPNPANSVANVEMNLKSTATLNVVLADITGREVFKTGYVDYKAGTAMVSMPLSSLQAGVYVYSIINNDGRKYYSGRLVKQ